MGWKERNGHFNTQTSLISRGEHFIKILCEEIKRDGLAGCLGIKLIIFFQLHDIAQLGLVWHGTAWHSMVWHDMAQTGLAWLSMALHVTAMHDFNVFEVLSNCV